MKELNKNEMLEIVGGRRLTRELIGIFELEDGRSEWFYRNPDGSTYSVIR